MSESTDRRGRSPGPSPKGSRSGRRASRPSRAVSRSKSRSRSKESKKGSSSSVEASPGSFPARGRSRVRRPSNPFSDENLRRRGYHSLISSFGKIFHVEKRWKLIREMGSGAYGVVISAADEISGETVAIKQVNRVFDKIQLAKRALREVTLLRHFANHENITGLIDLDAISPDFNEIYIFMEPMEADLHQIIKSGQSLTNEHVQYFLYQVLRGMKYVHSASVVHRDLKPGNLLVNADCELKICDFGLSRGFEQRPDEHATTNMTEYVATRWYRAPEIMLAFRQYDTAIDVWSIGCIFAELLLGKPLFKGKDYVDQLNKILDVLGTPEDPVITRIGSERAQAYIRSLPVKKRVPFHKIVPTADSAALDLLEKMLAFDPAARITVPDALAHPWLSSYHDEQDEPECPIPFEKWRYIETLETIDQFRDALWNEIQEYRREVRSVVPDILIGGGSQPASLERPHRPPPHSQSPAVSPAMARSTLPEVPEESSSASALGSPAKITENGDKGNGQDAVGEAVEAPVPFPAKEPDAPEAIAPMPVDPVVTYARRSSVLRSQSYSSYHAPSPRSRHQPIPSFDGHYHPRTGLSRVVNADAGEALETAASTSAGTAQPAVAGSVPFPGSGYADYVMPARSRTMSTATREVVSRKLLRTLSTVSIHETGAGHPGGLAEIAPIGRYILEKRGPTEVTEADRPPSDLPGELGGTDEQKGAGEGGEEEEKEEKEGKSGKGKEKDKREIGKERRAAMFTVG
ncbi:Pkinase-domain-containing protein [Punctularia strigosozonata HHB-11173 SS5]|uniref:Pkinase-domain-containing protein n=1 Tax=Punctularia strigosozonata (strain HHB-11173) TaxID=741275 RepID=UPI0004416E99|nr:Pkinase-domain-containing protein [Punctularia strigosozonata HHB-11173 SS5]EIN06099.1 Pkinase-domain-containing protein [Punctularia strigosozonata HHB-11173 SS5]